MINTSDFLCVYDASEEHHTKGVSLYDAAHYHLTTNYILTEYVALALVRSVPRSEIIEFSRRVLQDAEGEIVWVDEDLHARAVTLLHQRQDKTYSLCDAGSFVLMRERGVTDALTTDKHFAQEGFVRLLES